MSEEQKALNDVLEGNGQEPKETPEEPKSETPEPSPEGSDEAEQSSEEPAHGQQEPEEQKPEEAPDEEPKEEEKPEEPSEEKPEEPKEEPKEEKPAETKKPENEPEKPKKAPKQKIDNNVVLVGKKPTMSYVLAAVTQFSDGVNEVHIKSRGRSISRAVDVAEVVKNRFVQGVQTDINIGTQQITDEKNNKLNVSTIEIVLRK